MAGCVSTRYCHNVTSSAMARGMDSQLGGTVESRWLKYSAEAEADWSQSQKNSAMDKVTMPYQTNINAHMRQIRE